MVSTAAEMSTSSPSLWWALVSGLLLGTGADGFGKYLSHRKERNNEDEGDGRQIAKTLASKIREFEEEGQLQQESVPGFEVLAGLLLLAMFVFFGCVYICILQCWWRCKDMRRKRLDDCLEDDEAVREASATKDGKIIAERCDCCAETPWEPVDLDRCIKEANNNDDCISAITATTDEEEATPS